MNSVTLHKSTHKHAHNIFAMHLDKEEDKTGKIGAFVEFTFQIGLSITLEYENSEASWSFSSILPTDTATLTFGVRAGPFSLTVGTGDVFNPRTCLLVEPAIGVSISSFFI